MPTNRTKRTRVRQSLDYWKINQLVTGQFLLAGVGYLESFPNGHFTGEELAELRAKVLEDWEKVGADFMRWWRGDTEQFTAAYSSIGGARRDPAVLPWAAREFGVPAE